MAETRQENGLVLDSDVQNPAPFIPVGQVEADRIRYYADQILAVFMQSLPSNYVAQTNGPYYIAQFQAAAEQLAKIQVSVLDAYEDSDFNFTRPEVLFQFIGDLVFPKGDVPVIDGDVTYREFLRQMVVLLLTGSKLETLVSGLDLLTDAEFEVIDTSPYITDPNSAWGLLDRFTFEVNVFKYRRTAPQTDTHYHTVQVSVGGSGTTVTTVNGTDHIHIVTGFRVDNAYLDPALHTGLHTHDLLSDFPDLPFVLEKNARLVLKALKPAHTLYTYRNLFREFLGTIFSDTWSSNLTDYHYDEYRKYWASARAITGTLGESLDPFLFHDASLSFDSVRVGAILTITTGPNAGRYTIQEVLRLPFSNDPVLRPYTTSPTGLSGRAYVLNGDILDPTQTWMSLYDGETLTFASGPNAGTYYLGTLLGPDGGPVGVAIGPGLGVRPVHGVLRVKPRMLTPFAVGQSYTISLNNLGVKTPNSVVNEDVSNYFYGSSGTGDTFLTAFGPLVKPWGDMTPATFQDVTVLLDGVSQVVNTVNPYTGEITVTPPIPLFAPSAHTVTVSYTWFPAPVFGMAGLNTPGLTLNRWSNRCGRHVTSPSVGSPLGAIEPNRFPMGVVLGMPVGHDPVRVGHRFLGFERGYTASLNRPLSLKLNYSPTWVSVPYAETDTDEESISYSGEDPSTIGWGLTGDATGSVVQLTEYDLHDASITEPAYWSEEVTLPIGTRVYVAARIRVSQAIPSGVFTGVGFGFHDNNRTYFTGALRINALRHVGILVRPGDASLASSWAIGPRASGTIVGSNQVEVLVTNLPIPFPDGIKFQVLAGSQTGVYTVSYWSLSEDRTKLTIVTTTPFPANYHLYGNRDITLYFDVEWDNYATWRLIADTSTGNLEVKFSGEPSGSFVVTSGVPTLVSPAFLGIPLGQTGRVFWGSFGRTQTNISSWSFLRYLSSRERLITRGDSIQVSLSGPPEDDPNDWYPTTYHGYSGVVFGDINVHTVQVRGFEYTHIDPNLNSRWYVSSEAKLSSPMCSSGSGITFTLGDTKRVARLGALAYSIGGTGNKYLASSTYTSLDGQETYAVQGWLRDDPSGATNPVDPRIVQGDTYQILSRTGDESWGVNQKFVPHGGSKIVETRLSAQSTTFDTDNRCGLTFVCCAVDSFGNPHPLYLDFMGNPGRVVVRSSLTAPPSLTATVPWDDGVTRTYTVKALNVTDTLGLYVDDVLVTIMALSAMPVGATVPFDTNSILATSLQDTGSFQVRLHGAVLREDLNPVTVLKTFGIWLGGDPLDINQWVIPRLDTTGKPNSDPASVIYNMDWTSQCWVRLSIDPTWGVVFERPDLPLPPWYLDHFATESINPSAGWATVEYRNLPRDSHTYGTVSFGNANPGNTLQLWRDIKYRLFTNTSLNYLAPQGMVLNRSNVISSGEILKDTTPEVVSINAFSTHIIHLRDSHINASRVFYVQVDGTYLASDRFTFDSATQIITLTDALPAENYPVTVTFSPGKTITNTYLQTQPVADSPTLLYEGTPAFPESQGMGALTSSTVSGDGGPVPSPVFGSSSYILNDPYRVRQFGDDPNALYEALQFQQVSDGGATGVIFPLTDDPGIGGSSPLSLGFSGLNFQQRVMPGVPRPFSPLGLLLSGGRYLDGRLGPGTGPSYGATLGGGTVSNWEVFWVIQIGASPGSVLTDANLPYVDVPLVEVWLLIAEDQFYASYGPAPFSPSGWGSRNGSVWLSLQTVPTYSMYSPLGYLGSGLNSVLCGTSPSQPYGIPVGGTGIILNGGLALPPPPLPSITILGGPS